MSRRKAEDSELLENWKPYNWELTTSYIQRLKADDFVFAIYTGGGGGQYYGKFVEFDANWFYEEANLQKDPVTRHFSKFVASEAGSYEFSFLFEFTVMDVDARIQIHKNGKNVKEFYARDIETYVYEVYGFIFEQSISTSWVIYLEAGDSIQLYLKSTDGYNGKWWSTRYHTFRGKLL